MLVNSWNLENPCTEVEYGLFTGNWDYTGNAIRLAMTSNLPEESPEEEHIADLQRRAENAFYNKEVPKYIVKVTTTVEVIKRSE